MPHDPHHAYYEAKATTTTNTGGVSLMARGVKYTPAAPMGAPADDGTNDQRREPPTSANTNTMMGDTGTATRSAEPLATRPIVTFNATHTLHATAALAPASSFHHGGEGLAVMPPRPQPIPAVAAPPAAIGMPLQLKQRSVSQPVARASSAAYTHSGETPASAAAAAAMTTATPASAASANSPPTSSVTAIVPYQQQQQPSEQQPPPHHPPSTHSLPHYSSAPTENGVAAANGVGGVAGSMRVLPPSRSSSATPTTHLASASALSPPARSYAPSWNSLHQAHGHAHAPTSAGQRPLHPSAPRALVAQSVALPTRGLAAAGDGSGGDSGDNLYSARGAFGGVSMSRLPAAHSDEPASPTLLAFSSYSDPHLRGVGARLYYAAVSNQEARASDEAARRQDAARIQVERARSYRARQSRLDRLHREANTSSQEKDARVALRLLGAMYDPGRGFREHKRRQEALRRLNEERKRMEQEKATQEARLSASTRLLLAHPSSPNGKHQQQQQRRPNTLAPPSVVTPPPPSAGTPRRSPATQVNSFNQSPPPPTTATTTTTTATSPNSSQRVSPHGHQPLSSIPAPLSTTPSHASAQQAMLREEAMNRPSPIMRAKSFFSSLFSRAPRSDHPNSGTPASAANTPNSASSPAGAQQQQQRAPIASFPLNAGAHQAHHQPHPQQQQQPQQSRPSVGGKAGIAAHLMPTPLPLAQAKAGSNGASGAGGGAGGPASSSSVAPSSVAACSATSSRSGIGASPRSPKVGAHVLTAAYPRTPSGAALLALRGSMSPDLEGGMGFMNHQQAGRAHHHHHQHQPHSHSGASPWGLAASNAAAAATSTAATAAMLTSTHIYPKGSPPPLHPTGGAHASASAPLHLSDDAAHIHPTSYSATPMSSPPARGASAGAGAAGPNGAHMPTTADLFAPNSTSTFRYDARTPAPPSAAALLASKKKAS